LPSEDRSVKFGAAVLALTAVSCARHYSTTGVVLSVAPPAAVTISHDPFPDYMHAMTMPFALSGSARGVELTPGDRVSFRLAVTRNRSAIDRIAVLSASPADAGLRRTPAVSSLAAVGAVVPDFALVDQHERPVSLADMRGKVVLVSFIYTRCPLPDYCPRMIENFRAVRSRFAPEMDRDLVLFTVSFDPQYDTPARLAAYARSNRAETPGWHFLTGATAAIDRVCESFGIEHYPDEGLITHSLQTAVIGRDGRLSATIEGRAYTPRQLGDLVASALDSGR
jgi:protein SCO1/2